MDERELRIALVGFMGCGKSRIGEAMARTAHLKRLDLDSEIELRTGHDIPWIFSHEGEASFRLRESACLEEMAALGGPSVLSCGGGIILAEKNRRILDAGFVTVWIEVPAEELVRRLTQQSVERPLLSHGDRDQRIARLLEFRTPLYRETGKIRYSWTPEDNTAEKSAMRILGLLKEQGCPVAFHS